MLAQQNKSQSNANDIVVSIAQSAKSASRVIANANDDLINDVLKQISKSISENTADIIASNELDLEAARQKGLSDALIDRLTLTEERINAIASSVIDIANIPSPIGKELWETTRPNGLHITRKSVPIGVLGMIYESRPNVTVDAAALCLKSRNAVVLRGGSESLNSSLAFHKIIQESLVKFDLPKEAIAMIPTADRAAVGALLACHEYIDVLIPRGGKSLVERVQNEAKMPVFSHLDGICHIYVHHEADLQMAKEICLNAKMRRTGICGAVETILLDEKLSEDSCKAIISALSDADCEIVGDAAVQKLDSTVTTATDIDWSTEYLSAKVSIAVVKDIDHAVAHINNYGSHHTDSIVTNNDDIALKFQNEVDSGITMHNTSTQFADGGEFGMGAEIGIATGKMHARGPVGVEQLCSYKYYVKGTGQTRP